MNEITLTQPDDWHLHLRDDSALAAVAPDSAKLFGRAIIMPNIKPPVTDLNLLQAYKARILTATQGTGFEPLMTLYLTDKTTAQLVREGQDSGLVAAVKLYPQGATTNSQDGLTSIEKGYDVLAAMEEIGLPLLIHGEVTTSEIDIFDREKVFLEKVLGPLLQRFPRLKVVLEHATTKDAVDFVTEAGPNLAATITAHHLLLDRNDLLVGGIRPHYFCLPILKRRTHKEALVAAATSGNLKFFLGTDSAPHPQGAKESACGCAGVYTAHEALGFYAEAFEAANALDKLEAFASFSGPDFYGLPRNGKKITLVKEAKEIPSSIPFGEHPLVPFRAGGSVAWQVKA
ncbi:MAG: dihydroorotase [SAR324 cluster bacterium]|nr:dihydroorotase [SAR324 cluster bacterium]